jgi:hypothetical protein
MTKVVFRASRLAYLIKTRPLALVIDIATEATGYSYDGLRIEQVNTV